MRARPKTPIPLCGGALEFLQNICKYFFLLYTNDKEIHQRPVHQRFSGKTTWQKTIRKSKVQNFTAFSKKSV